MYQVATKQVMGAIDFRRKKSGRANCFLVKLFLMSRMHRSGEPRDWVELLGCGSYLFAQGVFVPQLGSNPSSQGESEQIPE